MKVAIQGEAGAFSHEAARLMLGADVTVLSRPSFDALFAAVVEGAADRGLVPIENSLAGSIHENYDRLQASPLHIVGETQLRIRHCLIARPGTRLEGLKRVASHPVALAQCRRFFAERPDVEAVAAYDTAGSVLDLMRGEVAYQGAIASALAAELYGGVVLRESLEDDAQNFTRFLVLSLEPGLVEAASKTSIVFTLDNKPGALHEAMGAFASRGVDLAKIESRPLRGRPWEYAFYLDILGDPRGPAGDGLAALRGMAPYLRVLGSYPDGLKRASA